MVYNAYAYDLVPYDLEYEWINTRFYKSDTHKKHFCNEKIPRGRL